MLLFANNADSHLKLAALAVDSQLYLADGTGDRFPQPFDGHTFFLTLVDALGNVEIVEVTERAGDVLTVTRARDGTSAKSFPAGSTVDHRVTAEVLRRLSAESYRGQPGGIAPLDDDYRLPAEFLPVEAVTYDDGDARYVLLSDANIAGGYLRLDANARIPEARLPANALNTGTADSTYMKLTARGAANGVAPLGADSKIPMQYLHEDLVDLSGYAPRANPTFSGTVSLGAEARAVDLAVTGNASFAAVTASTIATTGVVTIKGGQARGKLTFSTNPPSGTPADGDEWVQHEA